MVYIIDTQWGRFRLAGKAKCCQAVLAAVKRPRRVEFGNIVLPAKFFKGARLVEKLAPHQYIGEYDRYRRIPTLSQLLSKLLRKVL